MFFLLLFISHCASTITDEQEQNYQVKTRKTTTTKNINLHKFLNFAITNIWIDVIIFIVVVVTLSLCSCCYSSLVVHPQLQMKKNKITK